jgi:hypothetical protein
VGDFEDRIGLEKSPRMGDLGGEKVCNEANLNLCVHRSLKKEGTLKRREPSHILSKSSFLRGI